MKQLTNIKQELFETILSHSVCLSGNDTTSVYMQAKYNNYLFSFCLDVDGFQVEEFQLNDKDFTPTTVQVKAMEGLINDQIQQIEDDIKDSEQIVREQVYTY